MGKITIWWLGHAAFYLTWNEFSVYIDPRYMIKLKLYVGDFFLHPPTASVVLYTHQHADHCYTNSTYNPKWAHIFSPTTLLIGPEVCRLRFKGTELEKRFHPIQENEEIRAGEITVTSIPAYNLKRKKASGQLWHPKGMGRGYFLDFHGFKVYHMGDTEGIPELTSIRKLDVMIVPIDGHFTMTIEEACEVIKKCQPTWVIPMHNHKTSLQKFKDQVELQSLAKCVIIPIGKSIDFNSG